MGARRIDESGQRGLRRWRAKLARLLRGWGALAAPTPERRLVPPSPPRVGAVPPHAQLGSTAAAARLPGVREPLSVEEAVRRRDLTVLRREAADALAALGAAHALVASARFSQLHELRGAVERGAADEADLATVAADYLGWQSDQVRLFDALTMVLTMRVPSAQALELIEPSVRQAAEAHLASLTVEYQRRLLDHQFGEDAAPAEGTAEEAG